MKNRFKIITLLITIIIIIIIAFFIRNDNKVVNIYETSDYEKNNSNITNKVDEEKKQKFSEETKSKIQQLAKSVDNKIDSEIPIKTTDNQGKVGDDNTSERRGEIIPHNLQFKNTNTNINNSDTNTAKNSININNKLLSATQFDVKYDPRVVNITTPVKNQGYNGTCWTFSSLGAVETFMKTKSVDVDASEEHLRFVLSNDQNAKNYNRGYLNRTPDEGGNFLMTAAYLTNGFGYVNEVDAPYNANLNGLWNFDVNLKPTKIVDDIVIDEYDILTIKDRIVDYGAVDASFYVGNINGNYYNTTTKAYYYNGTSQNDHEVIIVGWDNDYSKNNFNALNRPQNNGAWLVKNSWGTTFGDNGYFWISYEDYGLSDSNNLFYSIKNIEDIKNNEKFVTNATLGPTNFVYSGSNSYKTMEIFDLQADDKQITEVTLFSLEKNIGYSVYLSCLEDETPVRQLVANSTFTEFGYTTVKLNQPYQLKGAGKYALEVIVVNMDESDRIIPIEIKTSLHEPVISLNTSYLFDVDTNQYVDYSQYGINFVNRITLESDLSFGDYKYIINAEDKAEIIEYTGNGATITIPGSVNGKQVEKIKNSTFNTNNSNLSTIIISEGIKNIDIGTFSKCTALESITLPSTITSLDGVLNSVLNLKNITLADNPNYTIQDNILYSKDITKLIQYPLGKLDTTYTMPSTINTLSFKALDQTKNLEDITISDNLSTIENNSFAVDGEKLKNIYVNNNSLYEDINGVLVTKNMKELVVYPSCRIETSYRIPDGIENIKTNAFKNSKNLLKLIVPKSVNNIEANSIISNGTLLNIKFLDNAPNIQVNSMSKYQPFETNYTIERYPWKLGFNTSNFTQYILIDIINDDPNITLNNSLKLDNSYISKINPSTKVSEISSNITTDFNIEIRDRNNNLLNSNDVIGTGTIINILDTNNILLYAYAILIYGDIDGDGNIKATDYVRIKNHIMEVLPISLSIELISGDVNRDSRISSNDYVLIKNSIMNENLPIVQ